MMKLTIDMRAKSGKFQELYQTLQAFVPAIRDEKGCQDCQLYRDVEDDDTLFLSIEWEAQTHLEQYLRSGSGRALLGAMELLGETARVRAGHDEPWNGIDALRRLREKM
jgi:quinol monooxygenase YgiN